MALDRLSWEPGGARAGGTLQAARRRARAVSGDAAAGCRGQGILASLAREAEPGVRHGSARGRPFEVPQSRARRRGRGDEKLGSAVGLRRMTGSATSDPVLVRLAVLVSGVAAGGVAHS